MVPGGPASFVVFLGSQVGLILLYSKFQVLDCPPQSPPAAPEVVHTTSTIYTGTPQWLLVLGGLVCFLAGLGAAALCAISAAVWHSSLGFLGGVAVGAVGGAVVAQTADESGISDISGIIDVYQTNGVHGDGPRVAAIQDW